MCIRDSTYYRGAPDLAAAAREYERAVALAPGSAWVQRGFGFFAAKLGHFELALAAARRAVSLDPQKALTRQVLAEVLIDARRYGCLLYTSNPLSAALCFKIVISIVSAGKASPTVALPKSV